jgi:hypothetical protein
MTDAVRRMTCLFAILALAAAPLAAKGKKPSTEPGKYTDWADEIDHLEIVEPFQRGDYERVIVGPFDTSGTPLPEQDDNSYEPAKAVLADVASPVAEGLRGELKGGPAVEVAQEGGAPQGKALIVRGKVVEMNPGSRAARYWGGFGAGAAISRIQGEVVDAATGKVLLRFDQERRSGVGVAGGDYVKLMQRNLRKIGEDLSLILSAF